MRFRFAADLRTGLFEIRRRGLKGLSWAQDAWTSSPVYSAKFRDAACSLIE